MTELSHKIHPTDNQDSDAYLSSKKPRQNVSIELGPRYREAIHRLHRHHRSALHVSHGDAQLPHPGQPSPL